MEFFEDLIDVSHIKSFMVQKMLIIQGGLHKVYPDLLGGLLIRCWHYPTYFNI